MGSPAQIETQMAWLAQLANDGEVVVQAPFANRDGNYVTLTQLAGMTPAATLQKWIAAEHVWRCRNTPLRLANCWQRCIASVRNGRGVTGDNKVSSRGFSAQRRAVFSNHWSLN